MQGDASPWALTSMFLGLLNFEWLSSQVATELVQATDLKEELLLA
jgi:hypothetical protein